ncbi:TolC family protein [Nitratifractor sp.]
MRLKIVWAGILCVTVGWSMSLEETIRYALDHSTALQKSRHDIEISRIGREEKRLEKFGEINLVGDYTHYNTARTLAPLTPSVMQSGAMIPETRDLFSIGAAYSVDLFTGFARQRSVEISAISQTMSQARLKLGKEELIYNVRSIYLSLLALEHRAKAQRRYIASLESLKSQINDWIQAGKKAVIDRLKIENQIASARAVYEQLRSNIESLRASMGALIGKDPGRLRELSIRPVEGKLNLRSLAASIPALERIRLKDLAIKRSQKAVEKSQAAYYPRISLDAYGGKNMGRDEAHSLGFSDETIWQIGVHLRWKLFDFGRRNLSVQKARIEAMKAQIDREQAVRDLKKLLRQAIAKIRSARASWHQAKIQERLSVKTASIERARYESGAGTINDLLLAEAQRSIAKAQRIEGRYNYQKSLFYLDYILEKGIRP